MPTMTDSDLHRACASMIRELEKDRRFLASEFWTDIGRKNMAMLETRGLDNFKRTISQNYFNWVVGRRTPMAEHVYSNWRRRPTLNPWKSSIEDEVALSFITDDKPVVLTAAMRVSFSGLESASMATSDVGARRRAPTTSLRSRDPNSGAARSCRAILTVSASSMRPSLGQ